jgi:hypothetical protein
MLLYCDCSIVHNYYMFYVRLISKKIQQFHTV